MNPSAPISALKRVLHVLDELGNNRWKNSRKREIAHRNFLPQPKSLDQSWFSNRTVRKCRSAGIGTTQVGRGGLKSLY